MGRSKEANVVHMRKWRLRTKQRIVNAMGGCCQICGYNKCINALALHHIDPSEKEFSFGKIKANPKSWDKIVDELRKCVMLCHNCHTEIHAGIVNLPITAKGFDEKYLDYKLIMPL